MNESVLLAVASAVGLGLLGASIAADVDQVPMGLACIGLAAIGAFVAFWPEDGSS